MNKIITIGREFGSGGREVGKRLAEKLGFAYYDKEIIEEISKRTNLATDYVKQIVEKRPIVYYPITTGMTLHNDYYNVLFSNQTSIISELSNTLNDMADTSDCVIVGRCADNLLRDKNPLRIFVYGQLEDKIARCRLKAPENENLSDRELVKMLTKVDKNRAKYYENMTGNRWGVKENYDLCINTSSVDIKDACAMIASLVLGSQFKYE